MSNYNLCHVAIVIVTGNDERIAGERNPGDPRTYWVGVQASRQRAGASGGDVRGPGEGGINKGVRGGARGSQSEVGVNGRVHKSGVRHGDRGRERLVRVDQNYGN